MVFLPKPPVEDAACGEEADKSLRILREMQRIFNRGYAQKKSSFIRFTEYLTYKIL
jgi:hypothetical protein